MKSHQSEPQNGWNRLFHLLYQAGVVAGLLKYSKDLIEAIHRWSKNLETPISFTQGDPLYLVGLRNDEWFTTTVTSIGLSAISLGFAIYCAWQLLRGGRTDPDATAQGKEGQRFWALSKLRKNIALSHEGKRFEQLGDLQMLLRAMLVLFVSLGALSVLLQRDQPESAFSHPAALISAQIHVMVSFGYLLFVAAHYFVLHRRHLIELGTEARQQESDKTPIHERRQLEERIGKAFWQYARWDLTVITLLWLTTLLPGRPLHLAYIIPLTGTWLFMDGASIWAFFCVLSGLLGRTLLLAYLVTSLPEMGRALGYDDQGRLGLLWEFLPNLVFWGTVGIILALLRYLRKKPKLEIAHYEETLKRATEFQKKLFEAQETARGALYKEARLRRALEILGTQRRHAVFAKDRERKFIFANEVLLERLAPIAQAKGWELDEKGWAKWEDIEGRTDEQIGIYHDEYKDSDDKILSGRAPHFEGYEPAFRKGETMLWTRKEAIVENGEVTGLVGYVVDGLPVQMQKMSQYLTSVLPAYASMKDQDGHIVWANKKHLDKLHCRIDELLQKELEEAGRGLEFSEAQQRPVEAKLKMLNGGRGPKDSDLYGQEGNRYSEMDSAIAGAATAYAMVPETFATSEDMRRIIVEHREVGRNFAVEPYPENGWMEFHRFPGETYGRWVEVRKIPWWEEVVDKSRNRRVIRGVLVFFQDNHKMYLRKSVVWRWLNDYYGRVGTASTKLMEGALKYQSVPVDVHLLAEIRLLRLLRRMLLWMKSFVDENPHQYVFSKHARNLRDFKHICDVIAAAYTGGVVIDCQVPTDYDLKNHGDDLFALLVPLVFNAIEATEHDAQGQCAHHPVKVEMTVAARDIVVTITNTGREIDSAIVDQLNCLQALTRNKQPGGGFFLAKRLALYLGDIATGSRPGTSGADVKMQAISGNNPGAKVTIRIPKVAFRQ